MELFSNVRVILVLIFSELFQFSYMCCQSKHAHRKFLNVQHPLSNPTLWNLSDGHLHNIHNDKYLRMFLGALFVRTKNWKQHRCSSKGEWLNKFWTSPDGTPCGVEKSELCVWGWIIWNCWHLAIIDLQSSDGNFRGFNLILCTCIRVVWAVVTNRPKSVMDKHNRSLLAAKVTVPGWGDEINDGGDLSSMRWFRDPDWGRVWHLQRVFFPRLCVNSGQKGEGAHRRVREALWPWPGRAPLTLAHTPLQTN